jgi:hypothetical protein
LTRLGSLTCTHDVRSFIIQNDTLLAITTLGTLEIFRQFNIAFDSSKKGGLTRPPTAEIQLTTHHNAKIEVQDVVTRGQETMISWVEGAKTGFEYIDALKMEGKVDHTTQTRREDTAQKQVPSIYDDLT